MKPFTPGAPPPHHAGDKSFYNGKYQVIVKEYREFTILSIRREDRKPIIDWRDMQWIKNQLLGPEVEAVQLFPAESRLVDTSNQFHLFASNQEGYRFPFGFRGRRVAENIAVNVKSGGLSQQRPFADHVRPADLAQSEELLKQDFLAAGFTPAKGDEKR